MQPLNCFTRNFSLAPLRFIFQHGPEKPQEAPKLQGEKKETPPPQDLGNRAIDAAQLALAKFKSPENYAKVRLSEIMKDMNPEQRLQHVKDRLQGLQESLKRVTGESRAARKAEQAPEREALLGYVEQRLHILAESLKRAKGEGRSLRSDEQAPEKSQLEQLRASLQR